MTKRSPTPIESFGPEILAALIAGATREITVETTYANAVKFRQRAHQLRSAMRDANHPQYPTVSRTRVSIIYGTEAGYPAVDEAQNSKKVRYPKNPAVKAKLVISPFDSEFTVALSKAGVEVRPLQIDPLTTPPIGGPIDDVLNDYLNKPTDDKPVEVEK